MRTTASAHQRRGSLSLVQLTMAGLAGPAGWTMYQGVGYALVKPACAAGSELVLWALALAALGLAVTGAALAWRGVGAAPATDAHGDESARAAGARRFAAQVALGCNLVLTLLALTAMVPQAILGPCD